MGELPPIRLNKPNERLNLSTRSTENDVTREEVKRSRRRNRLVRSESEPVLFPPIVKTGKEPATSLSSSFAYTGPMSKRGGRSLLARLERILAGTRPVQKESDYPRTNFPRPTRNKPLKSLKRTQKQEKVSQNKKLYTGRKVPKDPAFQRPEDSLVIRDKIAQFQKHHKENYTEKIDRLRSEVEAEKMLNSKENTAEKYVSDQKDNIPAQRLSSAKTWRTWRDVNQSDLYDDVEKYIQENSLMPPEKEIWIKDWIRQVRISLDV